MGFSIRGAVTATQRLDHQQRNELNLLHLRMEAIQRKIDRGELVDAQAALATLLDKFSSIDYELVDNCNEKAPLKQGRPISLLVVEDSDNERKLVAYLLAGRGFDVRVARDGLEALEQLQVGFFHPDFILMDLQMPLSNGLETLMQIRADEEDQSFEGVCGHRYEPGLWQRSDGTRLGRLVSKAAGYSSPDRSAHGRE